MYQELKDLFGKKIPSVRKFNLKLSTLSPERHAYYYKAAYDAAFTEWDTLAISYRLFLTRLLLHDKQRTADYLSDKLRKDLPSTDDLCDLLDLIRLDNEPGHL